MWNVDLRSYFSLLLFFYNSTLYIDRFQIYALYMYMCLDGSPGDITFSIDVGPSNKKE